MGRGRRNEKLGRSNPQCGGVLKSEAIGRNARNGRSATSAVRLWELCSGTHQISVLGKRGPDVGQREKKPASFKSLRWKAIPRILHHVGGERPRPDGRGPTSLSKPTKSQAQTRQACNIFTPARG